MILHRHVIIRAAVKAPNVKCNICYICFAYSLSGLTHSIDRFVHQTREDIDFDLYQAVTNGTYKCLCDEKKMSNVTRKPVFGVSDQVRHKPACNTTEDHNMLEMVGLGYRGTVLSAPLFSHMQKADFLMTRLKVCW